MDRCILSGTTRRLDTDFGKVRAEIVVQLVPQITALEEQRIAVLGISARLPWNACRIELQHEPCPGVFEPVFRYFCHWLGEVADGLDRPLQRGRKLVEQVDGDP